MKHWRYIVERGMGRTATGYVSASAARIAVGRAAARFTWGARDVLRIELHPVPPKEFRAFERAEHRAQVDRPGGRCGYIVNRKPCPYGCVPVG